MRIETIVASHADRLAMNAKLETGLQGGFAERVEVLGEPPPLGGVGGGSERSSGDVQTKERDVDLLAGTAERCGHLTDDLSFELLLRGDDVVARTQAIEVRALEADVTKLTNE